MNGQILKHLDISSSPKQSFPLHHSEGVPLGVTHYFPEGFVLYILIPFLLASAALSTHAFYVSLFLELGLQRPSSCEWVLSLIPGFELLPDLIVVAFAWVTVFIHTTADDIPQREEKREQEDEAHRGGGGVVPVPAHSKHPEPYTEAVESQGPGH